METALTIDYHKTSSVKLDIPSSCKQGATIEIRLWGRISDLNGWELWFAGEHRGTGTKYSIMHGGIVAESVTVNNSHSITLGNPFEAVESITTKTPILAYSEQYRRFYVVYPACYRLSTPEYRRIGVRELGIFPRTGETSLFGVFDVRYEKVRSYIRWECTAKAAGEIPGLVVNNLTGEVLEFSIQVEDEVILSDEAGVSVYLQVRDYITDRFVKEANVWIDNSYKGKTDEHGWIYCGVLSPGRHSLRIRKAGYFDSDEDDLANDFIDI